MLRTTSPNSGSPAQPPKNTRVLRWGEASLDAEAERDVDPRWIVAVPVIGPLICVPEGRKSRRLRPEAHHVIIVIGQDYPATGPHGACHMVYDRRWIGDMLQNEPCVGNVERAPFSFADWRRQHIAFAHGQQVRLAVHSGLAQRLFDLFGLRSIATTGMPVARATIRENCPSPAPKSMTRSPARKFAGARHRSFSLRFRPVSRSCSPPSDPCV